ncbi:hypothetical protein HEK616_40930 [Streptomyces nigrescens]|uniref:Minor tail protein n=1 Tax=Streptomyces nigrescens TaxID=1920 RepID=A0ABM7ZW82_STRNI|nr:hypothetical protein [Streptomyces nigrescens]BDM70606.1 hypothetical protein HEK616_40930 [Streptomyces nigrescens]
MSVSSNLLPDAVADLETGITGWTAGANTTLFQSTRFWSGAKSLGMTATAAGTVSATTTNRVAVVASQVYTAYAYFANIVATAGRTASVTVSWWAASAGGTAISSVTSTAATLATATTWNTPPPILIATAPAGALYASVTVTVTGLTAGAQVASDGIALGPPNNVVSSILDYGTAGCEVSTAGWLAGTNATVSRVSTFSYEGWWSLQIAATAAGDTRVSLAARLPVTPGTTYSAFTHVRPPADNVPIALDLVWYDGSGTLLSTTTYTHTGALSATWSRQGVAGIAPTSAATVDFVIRPQATTAGQTWLCDHAAVQPVDMGTTLLDFATSSAEVGTDGWIATGGTLTQSHAQSYSGYYSYQLVATGGVDLTMTLAAPVPVTPGQAYQFVPHEIYPGTTTHTSYLDWLDGAGEVIRTSAIDWTNTTGVSGWTVTTTADIAPPGAVSLRVRWVREAPPAGETWYLDSVLIGPGGLAALATPTADTSAIQITTQGLTLSGQTHWGLWRVTPDGVQTPLRGWTGDTSDIATVSDRSSITDYEAPLGVELTYVLETWNAARGDGWYYRTPPITLPTRDDSGVIIKDPVLPARTTVAIADTLPDWQRSARQGNFAIRGRARPIVISDVRTSRTGTLVVTTETTEEATALWWTLETGNTLLLQWPADWGLTDMYVQVGDVTESRISTYAGHSDRSWSIALTEVDRPIGGLVGSATRTWQDVKAGATTFRDLLSTSTTWLDVLTGIRGS